MYAYFENSDKKGFRGRPPITLPSLLNEDLKKCTQSDIDKDHNYCKRLKLQNKNDLNDLREIAQDRNEWNQLILSIVEGRQADTRQPKQ